MDTAKKYLNEYYISLQKECFKSSRDIKKKFEHAVIHKFRVSVKKMNAFKLFINFIEQNFEVKDKALNKIYRTAGKLRGLSLLKKELKALMLYDKHRKQYFRNRIKKENLMCRIIRKNKKKSIY